MERNEQLDGWKTEIRRRFPCEPTFDAMKRHLLFTMRSTSVRDVETRPDHFHIVVDWDGINWEGEGASEDEALGRILLAMSAPGVNPLPTGFEDRTVSG